MSDAAMVNLGIDQGADFSLQIYWTDAGNNPFVVLHPMRMDIKASTGQVVHSLTTGTEGEDVPDIRYNSESGLIQLTIPAAATETFPPGSYAYDLFVTYSDTALGEARLKRLLRGMVSVSGRITTDV